MSLPRGGEIERARQRIEEQRRRTLDADLAALEHQREKAEQVRADEDCMAAAAIDALLPASEVLAEAFRALERRVPEIRRQPLHEVTVQVHQPALDCVRASLRWGAKFGLTDADKQLLRSYRGSRRRLRRYPEVVVAHEYREVWAVLAGSDGTLRLSSGHVFPVDGLAADPAPVVAALPEAVASADRHARYHLRSARYEPSPTRR